MKVVELKDSFGLEHLTVSDRPQPSSPAAGEVVIRIRAASLNYRDLMMVQGIYNPRQPVPLIPCSDGSGEVIEIGAGVSRVSVGDRVCPIFTQLWLAGALTKQMRTSTLGGPRDGTLAEYMLLSEESLVKFPSHLSYEQAATLPCAAVTAWNALVTQGELKAGQTVLVQGSGGVSTFSLLLAKALGARVIATSGSEEKLKRLLELGAWRGINYRTEPEWGRAVRRLTDGVGVDLVVEVGGAGTLEESLKAVRMGGQISMIGVLSGRQTQLDIASVLMQNIRIQGILVGHRESFEVMNRALEVNQIEPLVDRTFPLSETRLAFEHLASGKHFGKVVIRLNG